MLARIILWIWLIAMAADVKASAFVPGSRLPCLQRLARDTRLCPGTPLSSERKIISPAALSRAMFRTEKKSPPPPPAPQQRQQKLQSPPPTPLQRVLSRSMLDITKPQQSCGQCVTPKTFVTHCGSIPAHYGGYTFHSSLFFDLGLGRDCCDRRSNMINLALSSFYPPTIRIKYFARSDASASH